MLLTMIPIVVALIAATVSVVQLLATRRNAREIETLKSRLHEEETRRSEYFRRYLESLTEGHERELAAFSDLLAAGQKLRDKLRLVSEYPETLDSTLVATELRAIASEVLAAYAANQLYITEDDREVAHEFKSLASAIATRVAALALKSGVSPAAATVASEQERLAASHAKLRHAAIGAAGRFSERLRLKADQEHA